MEQGPLCWRCNTHHFKLGPKATPCALVPLMRNTHPAPIESPPDPITDKAMAEFVEKVTAYHETECPVCAERRAKDLARVQRYRAKQRSNG